MCCAARAERSAPSRSPASGRSRPPSWPRCSDGATAVAVVERTDEPAAADNPLTREIKAALYATRGRRDEPVPRVRLGVGRARVARRRRGRPAGRLRLARRDVRVRASRSYARPRHPPSARRCRRADRHLVRTGSFACAATRSAGFGSVTTNKLLATAHRRALRQARPGVSALRLGEEGPADELLPDHRRRADPRSTASCGRSTSSRSTTSRRSRWATRSPASSTAGRCSSSHR